MKGQGDIQRWREEEKRGRKKILKGREEEKMMERMEEREREREREREK